MKHDKGFHYLEFPAKTGKAEALIVILHGHNNHPKMFEQLPDEIHKQHPGATVLIVQAPHGLKASQENKARKGVPEVDDLYTWHKLDKKIRPHMALAVGHAFNRISVVNRLNKFIDHHLAARGLRDQNLALFGFSMGGAMAVEAATKRKNKCAAVVCHSGLVLPHLKAKSKPDTLVVMGDKDIMFYTQRLTLPKPPNPGRIKRAFYKVAARVSVHHDDTVKRLKKAGIDVSEQIVPNLPHSINEASFGHSLRFMKKKLGK